MQRYIAAYFPALQEHLRSRMIDDGSGRSWLDIYTQHIADEPLNENKTSWEGLARQVKQADVYKRQQPTGRSMRI